MKVARVFKCDGHLLIGGSDVEQQNSIAILHTIWKVEHIHAAILKVLIAIHNKYRYELIGRHRANI